MTSSNPYNFEKHKMYRVSPMIEQPSLRGMVVVFHEWVKHSFDIRRAHVRVVGSEGDEGWWLVSPHHIVPL
jgi:hypothetical protein